MAVALTLSCINKLRDVTVRKRRSIALTARCGILKHPFVNQNSDNKSTSCANQGDHLQNILICCFDLRYAVTSVQNERTPNPECLLLVKFLNLIKAILLLYLFPYQNVEAIRKSPGSLGGPLTSAEWQTAG